MNKRIRQLFEKHTIPHFGIFNRNVGHLNEHGEYHNPIIEDHWQTFQEAAKLIVRECAGLFPNVYVEIENEYGHTPVVAADYIKKHFGVEK